MYERNRKEAVAFGTGSRSNKHLTCTCQTHMRDAQSHTGWGGDTPLPRTYRHEYADHHKYADHKYAVHHKYADHKYAYHHKYADHHKFNLLGKASVPFEFFLVVSTVESGKCNWHVTW